MNWNPFSAVGNATGASIGAGVEAAAKDTITWALVPIAEMVAGGLFFALALVLFIMSTKTVKGAAKGAAKGAVAGPVGAATGAVVGSVPGLGSK
ncbi:MAG: hypothetical protein ACYDC0_16295 [Acidimicrobiales bacterium]